MPVGLEQHLVKGATGFCEKLGFVVEGEEVLDAGIPHRHMRRTL